jgi:glycosyltransferase involved in cell wall biosynthesis
MVDIARLRGSPARSTTAQSLEPPASVLFVAAIWGTLKAFVDPIAREYSSMGIHTVGASAGAPESDEGFDECLALHEFRRRGPHHLGLAAYELARFVRRRRVGLLHLHTPAAVAMGRMVSRLTGVPAVAVVHGTFLGAGGTTERVFRSVERATGRFARSTVVLNEADAGFYEGFLDPGSVHLAPAGGAGVPVDRLRRALRDHPRSHVARRVVGYFGRMTPDKNLDVLVRALENIRADGHDVGLRLVGAQASGERGWPIPDEPWIETTGWLPDPYDAMAACDVVASASRREGFPMSVAEALVMGKPVVVRPNGGSAQQLKLAGPRLTVVSGDEADFASAILNALDNRSAGGIQEDLAVAWGCDAVVRFHREHLVGLYPQLATGRS